jgi:hypothetical protein
MIDVPTLITAVAGSSLIAGAIQVQGERRLGRTSRSDILKALRTTEEARWADGTNTVEQFKIAARELEVTALVTGVRQDVIEAYLTWAYVGADTSFTSLDLHGGDPEVGGGINTRLAIAIDRLARLVSDSAWRPFRHKVLGRYDLKAANKHIEETLSDGFKEQAKRTPWRRFDR